MKTLYPKLVAAGIVTQEQNNTVERIKRDVDYIFHSLFKDGSVELTSQSGSRVVYVERDGSYKKFGSP